MVSSSDGTQRPVAVTRLKLHTRPVAVTAILIGGMLLLALGLILSISVGAVNIKPINVWNALLQYDPDSAQHRIIHVLRVPRAIAGALVGACFAVAGAIMQGITRNPLADSGLLGLNAGAGLGLALCFAFFPHLSFLYTLLFSFLGACLGAILVFGIGFVSSNGSSPLRLALAGAAVTALLMALSSGIALYFQIGQDLAFWQAGGVAGTNWMQLKIMSPWIVGALLAAFILSKSITLLSLGEEVAAGLGQRIGLIKFVAMLVVLILAGSAVSVVGPIAFVGLIIPHLTRYLVGVDYRFIIPCSAVLGSLLIVLADIAARMINRPYETPIGALIALIGVPFFLYLARRNGGRV
ncbi:MAG: iron ABC transporter permease [Gorillibacterium sp.]|nr:iron ABC transporter permease [Gorillibacterium sp.]